MALQDCQPGPTDTSSPPERQLLQAYQGAESLQILVSQRLHNVPESQTPGNALCTLVLDNLRRIEPCHRPAWAAFLAFPLPLWRLREGALLNGVINWHRQECI